MLLKILQYLKRRKLQHELKQIDAYLAKACVLEPVGSMKFRRNIIVKKLNYMESCNANR